MAIRAHGWSRDMELNYKRSLEKKYKVDEFKSLFTFYYSGFNLRSSDFNASIGINQLKKLKKICNTRHKNFFIYKSKLKNFWSQDSQLSLVSSFGYATFIKNRTKVFKLLKNKNIQTRPLICGNMGQQPFLKKIIKNNNDLINANFVDKNGIYLPNHANLQPFEINKICKILNTYAEPIFFKK